MKEAEAHGVELARVGGSKMFGTIVAGLLVLSSILLIRRGRHKYLPAMAVSHPAMVFIMPGLRREAGLKQS